MPRLSGTESEAGLTKSLLRTYLAKQCDRIPSHKLDSVVFVVERTIEALIHAAVIKRSDLLQGEQLEQEINQLLLSYLNEKNDSMTSSGAIR